MKNPKKSKLVIFDLDGTLADTMPIGALAMNRALRKLGYPPVSTQAVFAATGNGARKLCERLLPKNSATPEATSQLLEVYSREYDSAICTPTKIYDGIELLLQKLVESGKMTAVVSNKPEALTQKVVPYLFPHVKFSAVRGARDDVPMKPDPTVALELCSALDVTPSDVAMVGDSETDLEFAVNAGLFPISVTWGYRRRDALISAGATVLADTTAKLLSLLL